MDILLVGIGFPKVIFPFQVDESDVVWWSLCYLTQEVGDEGMDKWWYV